MRGCHNKSGCHCLGTSTGFIDFLDFVFFLPFIDFFSLVLLRLFEREQSYKTNHSIAEVRLYCCALSFLTQEKTQKLSQTRNKTQPGRTQYKYL